MAGEQLKTVAELLADYPDNSAGLIEPVNVRNDLIGTVTSVGFLEDDPATVPVTIPQTNGVPQDVLSVLTTPPFVGNFWKLDGQNAFVPSYADFGITVPPGTSRLLEGSILMVLEKVGGGSQLYEFNGSEGGVFTGNPVQIEIGAAQVVALSGTRLYDVSVGAPVSFSVTPIGHSDDLELTDLRVTLKGSMT